VTTQDRLPGSPADSPRPAPADAAPTASPRGRWPWALAGLGAGVAGIGVAELAAAFVGPSSSPLVAVAQTFIDLTPPWLKDFAVRTFGTHDKQVLLTGAGLVVAALSAVTGLLARRRPGPALAGVLGLGAVAVLAAVSRPDATMLSALPGIAAAVTGAIVLGMLRDRGTRPATGAPSAPSSSPDAAPAAPPARRDLLVATGAVAAGGLVAGVAGHALGTAARGAETSRAEVTLPRPVGGTPVLPGGVEVGVPGVVPFRVPNADFYRIDTATLVPRVSTAGWQLRIHGMVAREVRLDWAAVLAGSLIERDVTLTCVSNEVGDSLIGNARWLGLPIGPLLKQAGPAADADMVLSTSADGWTAGTPLAVLLDGRDAMLAIGMNGDPLPIEHGFPARLVVPGLYGYVSATKWVVELEVTRFDRAEGYWTPRGWSALGPIKTESRIDVPRPGARVQAGRVAVAGIAWAQHRGVKGVQVRLDGGAWQDAQLGAEASVDAWRQWVYRWDAAPGHHKIAVRAVDGTGAVQTGDEAPPAPDGATGWHEIEVDVV